MGKSKKRDRAPVYFKEWRKFRHLTQEQAADRAGLSQPTITRLENGKQEPTLGNLEALAHAYACDPQALFSPPQKIKNELEEFLMGLDDKKRTMALKVLKALDSDEDAA